jgi:hypothetical protein
MKVFKLFLIICVAFNFSNCSTIKLTDTPHFTVSGASYHSWVGGQPGANGYKIIIGVNNYKEVTFKSIYFKNKKVNTSAELRKGKLYLVANILITRRIIKVTKTVVVKEGEIPLRNIKPPKVYTSSIPFSLEENEAVIGYEFKGKTFYYKVKKIKKTETIFYP